MQSDTSSCCVVQLWASLDSSAWDFWNFSFTHRSLVCRDRTSTNIWNWRRFYWGGAVETLCEWLDPENSRYDTFINYLTLADTWITPALMVLLCSLHTLDLFLHHSHIICLFGDQINQQLELFYCCSAVWFSPAFGLGHLAFIAGCYQAISSRTSKVESRGLAVVFSQFKTGGKLLQREPLRTIRRCAFKPATILYHIVEVTACTHKIKHKKLQSVEQIINNALHPKLISRIEFHP